VRAEHVRYDSFGNVNSSTRTAKSGSGLANITESAYYDPAGCDIHTTGPLCYRPQWYRNPLAYQSDFVYNTAGQLTQRTDPPDTTGVRRRTILEYTSAPNGVSRKTVVRLCGDVSTCGTPSEIRTEYQYWGDTLLPSVERRIDAVRGETLETRFTYLCLGQLRHFA
jgi:YD repeat-containing protein